MHRRWMPNEGGIRFPSNRQQEIYTIDHAEFLLLLLPPLIPATPSFDYRPTSPLYDCANRLRAFGIEKHRLLTGLRKRVAKFASFALQQRVSHSLAWELREAPNTNTTNEFASFQLQNTAVIFPSRGIVIFEAFCSLQSGIARRCRCRIMSIR